MMKQAKTSREAEMIFEAMEDRLAELWDKLVNRKYNAATQFAYEIGFVADIDDCLKKLKIKRTIVEQDNVQEIEAKDFKGKAMKIKMNILNEKKPNTCGSCNHTDNFLGIVALHCDLLYVNSKDPDKYNDGKVRSWNKCHFKPSRYEKRFGKRGERD